MREVYVDKLGLLPPIYVRATTDFYLRTTDVWRTRQSAESLLTGLWPPTAAAGLDSDVVPLHSYPAEIETMFPNALACDALAEIQSEQWKSPEWIAHLDVPAIWEELDSVLGIASLPAWHNSFDPFVDTFRTRQCHGLPLPCSKTNSSHCISQSTADFAFAQGDWEYQYLMLESPLASKFASVGISGFMSVLRDVILATVEGDASRSSIGVPDFAFFSGHDTTLGAVLGALNITGFRWPEYASTLLFEMWEQNAAVAKPEEEDASEATPPTYLVRVIYNGVVLPLYAAGCCEDLCPAVDVLDYLTQLIPEDLVEICAGDGLLRK
jgi:hypothetical protein